ncbi:MAG TPA: NADP-dependent phosphogluconate dehydrogenase [Bryobacterales bacterium]|nr:NADP-dependent phosphogluconate dehydrogenase [Bryobacterales bacterium]
MGKSQFGVVGLGVMGQNLALNAERNGFPVAGFDLDAEKGRKLAEKAQGKQVQVTGSMAEFAEALESPRRILVMVPAGAAVDAVIRDLKPHLKPEDIVIDGGNSYFQDTDRRAKELASGGLHFFGTGISGGEEGALWGPCLMPGGDKEAYKHLEPVFDKIAAKTEDGPCSTYVGAGSAGHYVKMVHNGIEYGIMQLLCETYDILRKALGMTALEVRDVYKSWNEGELNSFLMEISAVVLGKIDEETGKPLVDLVLDTAGQKGTGKWTAQNALDVGVPIPTLTVAVEGRILSGLKAQRVEAAKVLKGPAAKFTAKRDVFLKSLSQGFYLSMLACYAQGMVMLEEASKEYNYGLNLTEIARIWKGGCIIRSKLLDPIKKAYKKNPALPNLLVDKTFSRMVNRYSRGLRQVVQAAAKTGVPALAYCATLGYIDSYRSELLPANLLQAQRDYFGAHTYQRLDKEGVFHTEWAK